ncbi:hypothetical protein M569_01062 [Genlisea aurea]|uniref:Uncharacterized protein n=1 Tax=Genlisea aurea TaxID=192259 RepID=S8ELZ5_9LAMI|nr:hypothetical protein M569_01062 [Genlisea aurea]
MYRQKAVAEHSSSLLLQEGLFRRAIELLKSPPLETGHVKRKDVMALARGGYADTLLVQQSRKGEGERVKKWAETAWNNRRVSLAEALEVSQFSTVIDARICRVI